MAIPVSVKLKSAVPPNYTFTVTVDDASTLDYTVNLGVFQDIQSGPTAAQQLRAAAIQHFQAYKAGKAIEAAMGGATAASITASIGVSVTLS